MLYKDVVACNKENRGCTPVCTIVTVEMNGADGIVLFKNIMGDMNMQIMPIAYFLQDICEGKRYVTNLSKLSRWRGFEFEIKE